MHSFSWMSFGWKINQNNSWRRWDNTQHLLVVSYGPSRVVFFGCRDSLMLCISTSENNGKHSKIIKSTFVFLHASYMSLLCTWWKRYFFHHFWMFFIVFECSLCVRWSKYTTSGHTEKTSMFLRLNDETFIMYSQPKSLLQAIEWVFSHLNVQCSNPCCILMVPQERKQAISLYSQPSISAFWLPDVM